MKYKLVTLHSNAAPGDLRHAIYDETLTRVIAAFRTEADALMYVGVKQKADEVNAQINARAV